MADETFEKALEGAREIELIVTGRRSGRESSRPVWFVRDGDRLYLVPVTGTDSNWYKNVLETPTVRLEARGGHLTAEARPIGDASKLETVLDMLREKYGAREVEEYYPKKDAAVEVPLDP
jgi:deazaflavin-dependent oxidoreductase (nitroreductase family)